MNGVSYANALATLLKKLNIKLEGAHAENAKAFERDQNIYHAILSASQAYLHRVHSVPGDPLCAAGLPTYNYATVTRGIDMATLATFGVGLLPTLRGVQSVLGAYPTVSITDIRDIASVFFSQGSPDLETMTTGALVAPYWVGPDVIGGLKIRTIKASNQGVHKQDLWLTLGTEVERGLFGLAHTAAQALEAEDNVYVVEGEFDAMALYQRNIAMSGVCTLPVVAGAGGAIKDTETLHALAPKHVVIVPDNDDGGSSFVRHIIEDSASISSIRVYEIPDHVAAGSDPFDWSADPSGDFLQRLSASTYHLTPSAWAAQDIKRRLTPDGVEPDDPADAVRQMLPDYQAVLDDSIYGAQLLTDLAAYAHVDTRVLRTAVTPDIATGEGFDQALLSQILRLIKPLYVEDNNRLAYFANMTNTVDYLDLSAQNVVSNFLNAVVAPANNFTATNLLGWVKNEIGVPSFIATTESRGKPAPVDYLTQNARVQQHFVRVCREDLVSIVPPAHRLDRFKQGLHCMSETGDPGVFSSSIRHLQLINGSQHYTAVVDISKPGPTRWEVNGNCSPYPSVLFEYNDQERWSYALTGLRDLTKPIPQSRVLDMFKLVAETIHRCWHLEYGEAYAYYLASAIFSAVLQNASESAFNMHVTGKTGSGKTTLLSGLFYASGDFGTTLVEHSHHTASYTEAGLRTSLEGDARLFCIEEFEPGEGNHHDTQRNKVVNTFMEKTRDIYKGLRYDKFYASANAVPPFMKAAMATTGIDTPMLAQDANRRVTVSLLPYEQRAGHSKGKSPLDLFKTSIPKDVCTFIRKCATLYALQNAQDIIARYYELDANNAGIEVYGQHRTFRNVLMQAAYMDYLGLDGRGMAQEVCRVNAASLSQVMPSNEDALFSAIFDTPVIMDATLPGVKHSVRRSLHVPALLDQLNMQDCGVYSPMGADYVVVLFPKVITNLLRNNPDYSSIRKATRLITQLLTHPFALTSYVDITAAHKQELQQWFAVEYAVNSRKIVMFKKAVITG